MFQQSELQSLLKCRLLLTKLHRSHSFIDTSDNSRGQEQTVLKDLLLCFSVFNLLLLKLRGRKEEERERPQGKREAQNSCIPARTPASWASSHSVYHCSVASSNLGPIVRDGRSM